MKHKKLLSILLVTAMILSFAGCTREADNSTTTTETTTSEKQNPTSSNAEKEPDTHVNHKNENIAIDTKTDPEEIVDEESAHDSNNHSSLSFYQTHYGDFLEQFFTIFSNEAFSSSDSLPDEQILFFTLSNLVLESSSSDTPLSYDSQSDQYIVPQHLVLERAKKYFGIKPNIVDKGYAFIYDPEKSSYLFSAAHGFPIVYPKIASCRKDSNHITFHVLYTNPEQEGNPIIKELYFSFKELNKGNLKYLQFISSSENNQ